MPTGFAYMAKLITVGGLASTTGTSGSTEPTWPVVADGSGTVPPDGDITWIAIPLVKRLKSLKITVRYLDVSSDQMRQVTIIQSLID
jgi:hypothetical protein